MLSKPVPVQDSETFTGLRKRILQSANNVDNLTLLGVYRWELKDR